MARRNPNSWAVAFGNRLSAARESAGLTQEEVAQALQLELPTYRHYEKGRHFFPMELLERLSRVLHRSIAYFLGVPNLDGLSEDEDTLIGMLRGMPPHRREITLRVVRELLRARSIGEEQPTEASSAQSSGHPRG